MTVEQAPPPASGETPLGCPRCSARAEPGQLLCVSCGERLGLAYRRPPTWRLPAAVVGGIVLAAGIALALALAEITDDAEQVASAPASVPAAAPTQTQPVTPPPAQETAPAPPPAQTPAPTGEQGGAVESWPDDTSAYTVILLSAEDRAAAESRARDAAEAGVPAGVLHSDDYSSLNPGYWVVFGGRFDSSEEAEQEAERYASLGFPGGYPRFVNGGG